MEQIKPLFVVVITAYIENLKESTDTVPELISKFCFLTIYKFNTKINCMYTPLQNYKMEN